MMVKKLGETSPRNISRRDFLKLIGMMAAVPAREVLRGITPKEDRKSEIISIETPTATYFPYYEDHRDRMVASEFEDLLPLDVLFCEATLSAASTMLMTTEYLNQLVTVLSGAGQPDSSVEFFSSEMVSLLKKENLPVVIEGVDIFQEFEKKMMQNTIMAIAGFLSLLIPIKAKSREKSEGKEHISRKEFILRATRAMFALWAVSPMAFAGITRAISFSEERTTLYQSDLERLYFRLMAGAHHAHPEDSIVFFRNLFMAHRIKLIGEHFFLKNNQQARVAFNVGKAHAGIEDFIKLPQEYLLSMLNLYPENYWRKMIELNGGVEPLTTVPLFHQQSHPDQESVLIDEGLRSLLEQKLNRGKVPSKTQKTFGSDIPMGS